MVAHLNLVIGLTFTLAVILAGWLLFILFFPARWAAIVDGENAFWTKKGVIGNPRSETFKRLEKGLVFKVILVAALLLAVVMLIILVHFRQRISQVMKSRPTSSQRMDNTHPAATPGAKK